MSDGPNQAYVTFPGIDQIFRAYYSLVHGITPGVIQIEIVPQDKPPKAQGDIIWWTDNQKVLTLTDCRLDSASFEYNDDGLLWKVNILDRRWRWAYPTISKRANMRNESGIIVENTETSPVDLATLCLKAMGETDFVLNDLQKLNDTRPSIDWDYVNAAQALAELCDGLGCRVVLSSDNKVHICTNGKGATLPQDAVESYSLTPDPLEAPDNLILIGQPVRIQIDLKLEPLGKELDGSLRLLKDLSYAPFAGRDVTGDRGQYGGFDKMCGVPFDYYIHPKISQRANQFAKESVFKYWRIKASFSAFDPGGAVNPESLAVLEAYLAPKLEPFMNPELDNRADGSGQPWRSFRIRDIRQFVLTNSQVDQALVAFPNPVPGAGDLFDLVNRQAIVYGRYFNDRLYGNGLKGNSTNEFSYIENENGVEVNLTKQFQDQQIVANPELILKYDSTESVLLVEGASFQIDQDQRMVIFDEPIIRLSTAADAYGPGFGMPADLCLRCSFNLKDPDTNQLIRYAKKIKYPTKVVQNNLGTPSPNSKMPKVSKVVVCEEIAYTLKAYRQPTGRLMEAIENLDRSDDGLTTSQVEDQAKAREVAITDQYLNVQTPEEATYIGLKQIGLDGAICRVTWAVGPGGSETTAMRINDLNPFHLSYAERRFTEKVKRGFSNTQSALSRIQLRRAWGLANL